MIRIGIVGHIARREMAGELSDRVRADFLSIDNGDTSEKAQAIVNCANNHRRVLNELYAMSRGEGWCIVLEDDALPVEDFRSHAEQALAHAPSQLVGFYCGEASAKRNEAALEKAISDGIAWAYASHMVSAVGYAIRARLIPQITAVFAGEPHITTEAYITRWASSCGELFHYTLPSIVDHRIHQSLIFKNQKGLGRGAWRVGVPRSWQTPAVRYDP